MLVPAITHAVQHDGAAADHEILAWDSASTNCKLPFLLDQHIQLLRRDWSTYLDSRGGIPHLSSGDIFSTLHIGAAGVSLSVYHSKKRQALFWTEDGSLIPYYEQGAPFRTIINWMIDDGNHILIHAGAVGLPNGCVLLAGKGGSGKSTATLACIREGLSFISDDYCLVELATPPVACCLYNTAKLVGRADIDRFPEFSEQFELRDPLDPKSKPMAFLYKHIPGQIINQLPLKAILLSRISNSKHTYLRPANAAAALAVIAPNSIFQLPGAGKRTISAIGRLAKSLPCIWLDAGTDLYEIPLRISDYLQNRQED